MPRPLYLRGRTAHSLVLFHREQPYGYAHPIGSKIEPSEVVSERP